MSKARSKAFISELGSESARGGHNFSRMSLLVGEQIKNSVQSNGCRIGSTNSSQINDSSSSWISGIDPKRDVHRTICALANCHGRSVGSFIGYCPGSEINCTAVP